jgi:hypothetical protein
MFLRVLPIIPLMHAYRHRMARLALENMPFPLYQARSVLDWNAADGLTTQLLQYYMPYSTVFGVCEAEQTSKVKNCGQRYLTALPQSFRCDCVVSIVEPNQPIDAALSDLESIPARWTLVLAPYHSGHGVDWSKYGYRAHYEITEEPDDGVIVVAVRDREGQDVMPATPRILIISPVRQKPAILQHFLEGLHRLDTTGLEVAYLFIDNNDDPHASQILRAFAE